jgi:hypothetical protein
MPMHPAATESGFPVPVNLFATEAFADNFFNLLPTAIVIAFVGILESVSVAKALALKYGNSIDSNQEMIGIGLANAVSSFFTSFPSVGGFSRTMVNADAGARTTLAGLISGIILAIVINTMTALFYYLPSVTLGSMIVFAVSSLIEFETPRHLWAVDKADFVVYVLAFVLTILFGVENGILAGAGISLVVLIKDASLPPVPRLGRMPDGTTWRNVERFPGVAKEVPGISVFRFDANLFFANGSAFRDLVLDASRKADPVTRRPPQAIVIDCSVMPNIDSSGLHDLETLPLEMIKDVRARFRRRAAVLRATHGNAAAAQDAPEGATLDLGNDALDRTFASTPAGALARAKALDEAAAPSASSGSGHNGPPPPSGVDPYLPRLFLACVRSKVRDKMMLSDAYTLDLKRRNAITSRPSVWNCNYPCTVTNPLDGCASEPPPEHLIPANETWAPLESLTAPGQADHDATSVMHVRHSVGAVADHVDDNSDDGRIESTQEGKSIKKHSILSATLLAHQDINDAVTYVAGVLRIGLETA